jgi:hypothetical protein
MLTLFIIRNPYHVSPFTFDFHFSSCRVLKLLLSFYVASCEYCAFGQDEILCCNLISLVVSIIVVVFSFCHDSYCNDMHGLMSLSLSLIGMW